MLGLYINIGNVYCWTTNVVLSPLAQLNVQDITSDSINNLTDVPKNNNKISNLTRSILR